MAEPMDPGTRARYQRALSQHGTTGFVDYRPRPQAWILEVLECHPKLVSKAMYIFVRGGGEPRRIRERGDASIYNHEFHDDLVFPFRNRILYAETLFFDYPDDPDYGRIEVVSIKYN